MQNTERTRENFCPMMVATGVARQHVMIQQNHIKPKATNPSSWFSEVDSPANTKNAAWDSIVMQTTRSMRHEASDVVISLLFL